MKGGDVFFMDYPDNMLPAYSWAELVQSHCPKNNTYFVHSDTSIIVLFQAVIHSIKFQRFKLIQVIRLFQPVVMMSWYRASFNFISFFL